MTTLKQEVAFGMLPIAFCVLAGCSGGPERPEDLPPLTPCELTIMYNGSPLSDATVTLVPESGQWVGVGQTDQSGKATIQTQGRYEGVPAGSYTVTVTKREKASELPPDPQTPEEDEAYTKALEAAGSPELLVPEKYTKAETSDLKLTVSDSPVTETLELSD